MPPEILPPEILRTGSKNELKPDGLDEFRESLGSRSAPLPGSKPAEKTALSELQEVDEFLKSGAGALTTRFAYLGLRGQLHTSPHGLLSDLRTLNSSMAGELANRIDSMKDSGWRFWENRGDTAAGRYDANARDLTYKRQSSLASYILGATTEHPRTAMVPVIAHELGHHDALMHFPKPYFEGQSTERLAAFQLLASETNAIMLEGHVGQIRGAVIEPDLIDALKKGTLGELIHNSWSDSYEEFKHVTKQEAKMFVNDYVSERWGNPFDSNGQIKPYKLNPSPTEVSPEFRKYDLESFKALESDYKAERQRVGLETPENRMMRACQTGPGSTAIYGLKVFGALGLGGAVHSVRSSFGESTASGIGQLANVGINFGGFESGTALARIGGAAPIRRALVLGFSGAYAAEHLIGHRTKEGIKNLLQ